MVDTNPKAKKGMKTGRRACYLVIARITFSGLFHDKNGGNDTEERMTTMAVETRKRKARGGMNGFRCVDNDYKTIM